MTVNPQVIIGSDENAGVLIRQWQDEDVADWYLISQDDGLNQFSISGYRQASLERAQQFVTEQRQSALQKGLGVFPVLVRDTDARALYQLAGICIMRPVSFDGQDGKVFIEIAYRLSQAVWGKGYATAVAKMLISYGFNVLELKEIIGFIVRQNQASRRVLQKAGMDYRSQALFKGVEVEVYAIGLGG